MPSPAIDSIKSEVARLRDAVRSLHRSGASGFEVTAALADGFDDLLRRLFDERLVEHSEQLALVAIGGYGRRELCPRSDIDLLFLRESTAVDPAVKKFITLLWDAGFDLGHSVRTVSECYQFMVDDDVTASTLLQHRFVAGSRHLHERFAKSVVPRFRRRHGMSFARIKYGHLRESIEPSHRTIYVMEPHLKDGMCALRDIQRVLWIENLHHGWCDFEQLERSGAFSEERVHELRDAYEFFLRVRCENHFVNGVKQDVLDADSIVDVARNLRYSDDPREAVEGLLAEYFRHARATHRFVRHYIETGTQGRRFFGRLVFRALSKPLKPWLVCYRGRLFLRGEPGAEVESLEEEILETFVLAYDQDLRFSEGLLSWLRERASDPDLDFHRSTVIAHGFLRILRGGKRTGRILKKMHEAGVLGRIIPEFEKLECMVNLDGHHQFTVDEHILRTLEALDTIENGTGTGDEEFRAVLGEVSDVLPLRLGLLLHDIGKATPGDHSVSGSEAANLICRRLGLSEGVRETVEFLVYHHLRMFEVSQVGDFTSKRVVESFGRLVGSVERLRMLYLMTYVDILSVGPGTWTAWKGAQLADLYRRTADSFALGEVVETTLDDVLAASHLPEEDRARARALCESIDTPSYARETVPERMLYHADIVDRHLSTGVSQIGHESFAGFDEVTFCARDRARLFADLTGLLHSEGLNVLGASIYSRSDGVALDVFFVEVADGVRVDVGQRMQRLERKLRDLEARKVVVNDLILRWQRAHRYTSKARFPKALYGPAVKFDNDVSDAFTVIEVSAGDRPGLLHDVTRTLGDLGLDIRTARVSTISNRAHDVFHVVEHDRQKVTNPARQTLIAKELVDALNGSTSGMVYGGIL